MGFTSYKDLKKEERLNYADVQFHALLKLFDMRCDEELVKFSRAVTALDIIMGGFKDDGYHNDIMQLENQKAALIEKGASSKDADSWFFDEKAQVLTALIKRVNKEKPRIREFVTQSELVKEIARKCMSGIGQNIFITGMPGSGKSVSGLSIAWNYCLKTGVKFSIDNCIFDVNEFMKIYNDPEKTPEGGFILFDEIGLSYGSRDWQSEGNKTFGKLLQTIRHRQIAVIMTAPDLSFIDTQGRKLLHWWMETEKLDKSRGICFIAPKTVDVQQSTGKIFYPYPVFDKSQLSELRISKSSIPQEIVDQYEAKAKVFKDKIAADTETKLAISKAKADVDPDVMKYCTMRRTMNQTEIREKTKWSSVKATRLERIYKSLN